MFAHIFKSDTQVLISIHISSWIPRTELTFFLKKMYFDKLHVVLWKKHNHRHELQKLRIAVYPPLINTKLILFGTYTML